MLSPERVILRTESVEQLIDGPRRDTFVKQIVMTPGQPIGMVRKRRLDLVDPGEPEDGPSKQPRTRGALMLVHGFGQNRYTWHTTKRSFSAYLAHHGWDVFNVDLRGHGRSARFDGKRPEALDEYVLEDVPACAREVMRLSGHDRIVLVGHSMGGLISYSAGATKLKEHVRAIVTLGSPYRFGKGTWPMKALALALESARATGIFDANVALPLRYVGYHLRKRQRLWNSKLFPTPVRAWRPDSMEPDILAEYLATSFETTNLTIAFDIFAGGDRVALRSRDGSIDYGMAFEGLQAPLLVVAGDKDDLAPPESCRAAFDRSKSRDKLFRVFPAGHVDIVIGREAVTTIWPLVQEFLASR